MPPSQYWASPLTRLPSLTVLSFVAALYMQPFGTGTWDLMNFREAIYDERPEMGGFRDFVLADMERLNISTVVPHVLSGEMLDIAHILKRQDDRDASWRPYESPKLEMCVQYLIEVSS